MSRKLVLVMAVALVVFPAAAQSGQHAGELDDGAIGGNLSSDPGGMFAEPHDLEGVRVELWAAGVLLRTTWTDASGSYRFADLEPGMYQIRLGTASGRAVTLTAEVFPGTTTEASPATPVTATIPLEPTQEGCLSNSDPDGPACANPGASCRVFGARQASCQAVVQSPYPGAPPYRYCACVVGIGRY